MGNALYEIKCATAELKGLTLSKDQKWPLKFAHDGGQTILRTDDLVQRDSWLKAIKEARIKPLFATELNVDPQNPDPALVSLIAATWSHTATLVEAEMCVGWDAQEPTPFVREVSAEIAHTRPQDSKAFDKKYFGFLS